VRDANRQQLAYVYYENEPALRSQAAQQGRGAADRGEYRQAAVATSTNVKQGGF